MAPKSPQPVRVYGAVIILRHAATIQQIIQARQIGVDLEAVHDLRVATRRLRTALNIFAAALPEHRAAEWERSVATVTHALGAARDCDVQIEVLGNTLIELPSLAERSGVRRLLLRLTQKRSRLQDHVLQALAQFEKRKVIASFSEKLSPFSLSFNPSEPFSPRIYELARQTTQERLQDFLSYEPFVHQPECVAELHAMRIAAKRLRYSVETFADLVPEQSAGYIQTLKKTQDALGLIHDCDVWLDYLPRFIEKETERTRRYYGDIRAMRRVLPGLQYFQAQRAALRQATYGEFVALWDKWQASQYWLPFTDIYTPPQVEVTPVDLPPVNAEEVQDAL